jgi:predicted amidophosphoribosyltransferase
MRKLIPRKVKKYTTIHRTKYKECPSCKNLMALGDKYCSVCGQRVVAE